MPVRGGVPSRRQSGDSRRQSCDKQARDRGPAGAGNATEMTTGTLPTFGTQIWSISAGLADGAADGPADGPAETGGRTGGRTGGDRRGGRPGGRDGGLTSLVNCCQTLPKAPGDGRLLFRSETVPETATMQWVSHTATVYTYLHVLGERIVSLSNAAIFVTGVSNAEFSDLVSQK